MFYIDWYYIVLVLPAVVFASVAGLIVKSTYAKYSKVASSRGLTGAEAAHTVLSASGVGHVRIDRISGDLTDNYDPRNETIHLSQSVYGSTSVAALGVAAHEAGHAVQHAEEYVFFKLRSAIVPVTNISSQIGIILIPLGIVLCYLGMNFAWLAYLGVILYSACLLFQLVTLPTEFNASRRALKALSDSGTLTEAEIPQARRVLTAAAMTYVASLAVSLMTVLRFILLINNSQRRK